MFRCLNELKECVCSLVQCLIISSVIFFVYLKKKKKKRMNEISPFDEVLALYGIYFHVTIDALTTCF